MLQRLLLSFALIFLFGLGQQGAVTHAVSHITDIQQHDKSNHGTACDKCVVYAELGSAVGSTTFSLPAMASFFQPVTAPAVHTGSVLHRPYSARAPPVLA